MNYLIDWLKELTTDTHQNNQSCSSSDIEDDLHLSAMDQADDQKVSKFIKEANRSALQTNVTTRPRPNLSSISLDNVQLPINYNSAELTKQALDTLKPGCWLDDEIINAWMELIQLRNQRCIKFWESKTTEKHDLLRAGYNKAVDLDDEFLSNHLKSMDLNTLFKKTEENEPKKILTFTTFFWSKLTEDGYNFKGVQRWTKRKKIDIFGADILLLPVHVTGAHWALGVIHMEFKRVYFLDSLANPGDPIQIEFAENAKKWVNDEHSDKKGCSLPISTEDDWSLVLANEIWKEDETCAGGYSAENPPPVPQQNNGNDCGVFTCWHAECISDGRWPSLIDFQASDMPELRLLMMECLIEKHLPSYNYEEMV